MKRLIAPLLLLLLPAYAAGVELAGELPVDEVWSGHPVGFALLTEAPWQFVAYYNAGRDLVVAARQLDETDWNRVVLPERIGWDSHNYLTMVLDDKKNLHLSGNMHVDPLVYFKTTTPLDISTLQRVTEMVGREEDRMTYPRFFRGPSGEFIYTYRDGSSGSGNQIYNVYDEETDAWSRLLDKPLTDGQGKMNAYPDGPHLGPGGMYHLVWVWRDTPDCETNHDISYMRSRDLRTWENVRGETIELPATIDTPDLIVDPVPPGGGLINGNAKLGFDLAQRPVVSYHKYDAAGNSQVFNARWDNAHWNITAASDWDTRWDFGGRGSINFDVRVQPVRKDGEGGLYQAWSHWKLGTERWQIDPETLRATRQIPKPPPSTPPGFHKVNSDFPGLSARTASDSGRSPEPGTRYLLRWETLGRNRDLPRDPPLPDPSQLVLYKLQN